MKDLQTTESQPKPDDSAKEGLTEKAKKMHKIGLVKIETLSIAEEVLEELCKKSADPESCMKNYDEKKRVAEKKAEEDVAEWKSLFSLRQ